MPHVCIISALITITMDSAKQNYPDYLNPFDDDDDVDESGDENKGTGDAIKKTHTPLDEYPDYLSPFGEEETTRQESNKNDDYDDSLNPFGDETESDLAPAAAPLTKPDPAFTTTASATEASAATDDKTIPPVGDKTDDEKSEVPQTQPAVLTKLCPPEESLGPPPVPLPRTRSLLKKELAIRNKQPSKQQATVTATADSDQNDGTSMSTSGSNNSSLTTTTNNTTMNSGSIVPANNEGSFQRKKNKRNAPPLPVNFKRQVSGSAEAIEEELNNIGDRLAELEVESNACQIELKRSFQVSDTEFAIARAKFVEIIRMKNSILRRQKELMYRKREITLDQNHSDIEYELRMIGNKQSSNQTPEDDTREKELLKKLVEIVEEKSDIVENLNRDTCCDIEDVEEALRRMNLSNGSQPKLDSKEETGSFDVTKPKDSYKSNNLVSGAKFSKIATLLPKSGTLKGTMKLKRKRLFKKSSHVP